MWAPLGYRYHLEMHNPTRWVSIPLGNPFLLSTWRLQSAWGLFSELLNTSNVVLVAPLDWVRRRFLSSDDLDVGYGKKCGLSVGIWARKKGLGSVINLGRPYSSGCVTDMELQSASVPTVSSLVHLLTTAELDLPTEIYCTFAGHWIDIAVCTGCYKNHHQ